MKPFATFLAVVLLSCFSTPSLFCAGNYVAFLDDAIVGADRTFTYSLENALAYRGVPTKHISFNDIKVNKILDDPFLHTLILTESAYIDPQSIAPIIDFLRKGRNAVFLGGATFSDPLTPYNNEWFNSNECEQLFQFNTKHSPKPFTKASLRLPRTWPIWHPLERKSQRFENGKVARTSPSKLLTLTAIDVPIEMKGFDAFVFNSNNENEWLPILEVLDSRGRHEAWALALNINIGGAYKGGKWLLSGVENRNFYDDPAIIKLIAESIVLMSKEDLVSKVRTTPVIDVIANAQDAPPANSRPQRVVLNPTKNRFEYENGTPFFIKGCHYSGPANNPNALKAGIFDKNAIEQDFKNATNVGINCFLLNASLDFYQDQKQRNNLFQIAERHNIHLILYIGAHGNILTAPADLEQIANDAATIAEMTHEHPMVIGYDLLSNPDLGTIASITHHKKNSPLMALNTASIYEDSIDSAQIIKQVQLRPSFPRIPRWIKNKDTPDLYAGYALWKQIINPYIKTAPQFFTMPGLHDALPLEGEFSKFKSALNKTFENWIAVVKKAIQDTGCKLPITVSYNSVLTSLPANEALDFVSHNIYSTPLNKPQTIEHIQTFDRLKATWPEKPILLHTSNYSNGQEIGNMPLSAQSSCIGEMAHILYAHQNGHAGVMRKELNDIPIPTLYKLAGTRPPSPKTLLKSSRMGFFGIKNYPKIERKPIAAALAFFSEFQEKSNEPGELEITDADLPLRHGFKFSAPTALFIGDNNFNSDSVTFRSPTPVTLMIHWDNETVRIMATGDLHVIVDLNKLTHNKAPTPGRWLLEHSETFNLGNNRWKLSLAQNETIELIAATQPEAKQNGKKSIPPDKD